MNNKEIFQGINKRIELDRDDSDSACYEALTLKFEYLTKLVTAGLIACISDDADRHRYTLEHGLVRADSIGKWAHALNTALTGPAAQFFLPASRPIVNELMERVKSEDWRHSAVSALGSAASEIGSETNLGKSIALRQFFEIGAGIRNRSRGHGATTTKEKSRACSHLEEALSIVCENLRLFELEWVYLHRNLSGKYRVSPLTGKTTSFDFLKSTKTEQLSDGVYVYLDGPVRVNLVFSDPDLHDISLPNGNYKRDQFEILSYITNNLAYEDGKDWTSPIGQLPPSETEGSSELEPFGKSHANVPPVLDDYVDRHVLVNSVISELLQTDHHPILTLTGPGGIGKTTVTIAALHKIKDQDKMPYQVILWISARDIDLLESGAKPVRPRVVTQKDISNASVELLGPEERDSQDFSAIGYFEKCLRFGAADLPTLFVLDNFETIQSPADIFSWLDTHIRPPNKIIITTRIREFRGDFPLEISGMTDEEADMLIDQHSCRLNITQLVSPSYKKQLISESDGHPYVIRIMLGQVAEKSQTVKHERIMADSDHILRTLFERTYSALEPGSQKAFLLLSSWKVFVPEVAIQALLMRPESDKFDVAKALDQLHRFSLVERLPAEEENHMLVGTPLAASVFGRMKLQTSEFRVSIEKDRKLLMEFGPGRGKNAHQRVLPRIENLYKYVATQVQLDVSLFEKYRPILEFLAGSLPRAFNQLSDLAWEIADSIEMKKLSVSYLRRYLETVPPMDRKALWQKIADRCRTNQDAIGEIHALCEAAYLSASNSDDLGDYANRLNRRIREMKSEKIDAVRSPEIRDLIHKVIDKMEPHLKTMTATNCSRLAWLYLSVENKDRAHDVAKIGLKKNPHNYYCQSLIQRLSV